MNRNILGIAVIVGVLVGVVIGIAVGPWTTAAVSAQTISSRFQLQRTNEFMFIHDTKSNECYLAIAGGGIMQASC